MKKTIVDANLKDFNGPEALKKVLEYKVLLNKTFNKLKEIVEQQKSYEEESLMYTYKGSDKDLIWSCMEFFYKNLWNPKFREFVWSDPSEEWENYNIQLKYKDKYSSVCIVYGIGSFCVIGPDKNVPNDKSKILDLEKIQVLTTTEVIYLE